MGLFGYNEKQYIKNTRLIIGRLQALSDNLLWDDVKRLVDSVIEEVGKYPYVKTDGKFQKGIDDGIFELIDGMEDLFRQDRRALCAAYGEQLWGAVEVRRLGK